MRVESRLSLLRQEKLLVAVRILHLAYPWSQAKPIVPSGSVVVVDDKVEAEDATRRRLELPKSGPGNRDAVACRSSSSAYRRLGSFDVRARFRAVPCESLGQPRSGFRRQPGDELHVVLVELEGVLGGVVQGVEGELDGVSVPSMIAVGGLTEYLVRHIDVEMEELRVPGAGEDAAQVVRRLPGYSRIWRVDVLPVGKPHGSLAL